jgi:hypothetical protein
MHLGADYSGDADGRGGLLRVLIGGVLAWGVAIWWRDGEVTQMATDERGGRRRTVWEVR